MDKSDKSIQLQIEISADISSYGTFCVAFVINVNLVQLIDYPFLFYVSSFEIEGINETEYLFDHMNFDFP